MRGFLLSLLAALAVLPAMGGGAVRAQYPVRVQPYPLGPEYTPDVPPDAQTPRYVGPEWTVNLEYLLWFIEPIHFNTPLVGTTTDPNVDLGGAVSPLGVGQNGFVNYFGPGSHDRGPFSGGRLSITRALPVNLTRVVYTELAAMWLPRHTNRTSLLANPAGNPAILLPFTMTEFDPALGPPGDYSLVVAGNLGTGRETGNVEVVTGSEMWGGEWNVAGPLFESANLGLEGIIGFRYQGLAELVDLRTQSTLGGGFQTHDRVTTANHFYGGQVGFRLVGACEKWAGVLTTKVGLGDTNANLDVRGEAGRSLAFGGIGLPGGFYTDQTNIGESSTDHFAVVVDVNLGVRYAVCPWIGLSVGYNFLYWTGIYRPGEQLTRVLNPANNAILNGGSAQTPTPTPLEPSPAGGLSDIWAHGVNLGLDFRF